MVFGHLFESFQFLLFLTLQLNWSNCFGRSWFFFNYDIEICENIGNCRHRKCGHNRLCADILRFECGKGFLFPTSEISGFWDRITEITVKFQTCFLRFKVNQKMSEKLGTLESSEQHTGLCARGQCGRQDCLDPSGWICGSRKCSPL